MSSICISSRSLRSSAPSGSSRSRTRGRFTSARASATRCRWPPESWPGLRLLVAVEADHRERLGDPRRRARPWGPCGRPARRRRSPRPSCAGTARSPGTRCSRRARTARSRVTSRPWRRTRPAVGSSNPAIIRRVVVLPEPDGPSIEKNSPSAISRSMPGDGHDVAEALLDALEPDGRGLAASPARASVRSGVRRRVPWGRRSDGGGGSCAVHRTARGGRDRRAARRVLRTAAACRSGRTLRAGASRGVKARSAPRAARRRDLPHHGGDAPASRPSRPARPSLRSLAALVAVGCGDGATRPATPPDHARDRRGAPRGEHRRRATTRSSRRSSTSCPARRSCST